MYKYFILLFCFLGPAFGFGQIGSISGYVTTEEEKPIAYASVSIASLGIQTYTDDRGEYRLDNISAGLHMLSVSFTGYAGFSIEVQVNEDQHITLQPIVLSAESIGIELVEVSVPTSMRMRLNKRNKLEVSVANTNFQYAENVWEGLKQVPLLRTHDTKGLQVGGKLAIVEINGIQSLLSAEELQHYLMSLNPATVKSIEMNPNPGAAYGSEVDAVVNIVLKESNNDYRLGIYTENGVRKDYNNRTSVDYALNLEKLKIYTSYQYNHTAIHTSGSLSQHIPDVSVLDLSYDENNRSQGHQYLLNVQFGQGKSKFSFHNNFNFNKNNTSGESFSPSFERGIDRNSTSHRGQFSQVWRYSPNDTTTLEVGAHQVFRNSDLSTMANTLGEAEAQNIDGKNPIYILFADYEKENKWGATTLGAKFHSVTTRNDNEERMGIGPYQSQYRYNEKVAAVYLQHAVPLSDNKNLEFGLRSETTMMDYEYENTEQKMADKQRYTSLLYNVSYNTVSESGRYNMLAFRKQIQRPNYHALNPFQAIESDVIYQSGDTELRPSQHYTLSWYHVKDEWTLYTQAGYINDFISNFFELTDQNINNTYRNFKDVYLAGIGAEYNRSLIPKRWVTKTSADLTYFKLVDDTFEQGREPRPQVMISSNNVLTLGKNWRLNLNYEWNAKAYDGLLKHYSSHSLDATLSKTFANNLSVMLIARDIFKTDRTWHHTTVPGYFYSRRMYNDKRYIGLSLRWSISGKAYKRQNFREYNDDSIERLDR